MSFNSTNRLRSKKRDLQDSMNEFPKTLLKTQEIAQEIFKIFDEIGKNLVNLAMFNIDPDILDKFDRQFKDYSVRKGELNRFFDEISRFSSMMKDPDLFSSDTNSSLNESVIDDLQDVLTNINQSIGSDIVDKLEELKSLKNNIENMNSDVKLPVEQINESLQLFQKTTDVSFEIFTKSMLESLKNSVEMRANTENIELTIQDIDTEIGKIPEKVQNALKEEIRAVVNEGIGNLDARIQKVLEEKIKDIKLSISTEIANVVDQKFNSLLEVIKANQQPAVQQTVSKDQPLSRDMQEMNIFLKYLYTWPTSKDDLLKKIEDFRDTLLVKRTNDPPFRVTATNSFREAISEISREERHISENKVRDLVQLFENLKRTIENSER